MWDLSDYIKTWLQSHRCANNMRICTAASQKSAMKQEYPVQTFSDVVETVTSETETETWLKFRDETETLP